jgi:hypothetical protein
MNELEIENKKLKLALESILNMQDVFYTEGCKPYKRLHPDLIHWSGPLSVIFRTAYAAVNNTEEFQNWMVE